MAIFGRPSREPAARRAARLPPGGHDVHRPPEQRGEPGRTRGAARAGRAARIGGSSRTRWGSRRRRCASRCRRCQVGPGRSSASSPRCSTGPTSSCSTNRRTGSTRWCIAGSVTCSDNIAGDGRTVLLSSHVLGEVEDVCDRVVLIKAARVIRVADVDTLRSQAQRRVTLRYSGPHPAPELLHDSVVTGTVVVGRIPAGRPDLVRELLTDPDVSDIEIEPPSLEDVFLGMYDEGGVRCGHSSPLSCGHAGIRSPPSPQERSRCCWYSPAPTAPTAALKGSVRRSVAGTPRRCSPRSRDQRDGYLRAGELPRVRVHSPAVPRPHTGQRCHGRGRRGRRGCRERSRRAALHGAGTPLPDLRRPDDRLHPHGARCRRGRRHRRRDRPADQLGPCGGLRHRVRCASPRSCFRC